MRSFTLKTLPIVYQNTFKLQPEVGLIKKPKHVTNMMF